MDQMQPQQAADGKGDVTVATNYCVNTNRTYVYELRNGEIISEKRQQGAP
jgi:hypothetical protein